MGNSLIIVVDEEPDGEGWFECQNCGLHTGFAGKGEAQLAADDHDTFDCADELAACL